MLAGLLYTAMPRADMVGSAIFLDKKNKIQGEVLFGKVQSDATIQNVRVVQIQIHSNCASDFDDPTSVCGAVLVPWIAVAWTEDFQRVRSSEYLIRLG